MATNRNSGARVLGARIGLSGARNLLRRSCLREIVSQPAGVLLSRAQVPCNTRLSLHSGMLPAAVCMVLQVSEWFDLPASLMGEVRVK